MDVKLKKGVLNRRGAENIGSKEMRIIERDEKKAGTKIKKAEMLLAVMSGIGDSC